MDRTVDVWVGEMTELRFERKETRNKNRQSESRVQDVIAGAD